MSTDKVMQNEAKESLVIYEVGYLVLPTLPEEKMGEVVSKLHSAITDKGGVVIAEEAPKMRPLAYTMTKMIETKRQKFDHAYFAWIKFEVDSTEVAPIKKSIEAQEQILRAIFIKTVRESTLMASKVSEREAQKPKAPSDSPDADASGEAVAGTVAKKVSAPADEEEIDKSIEALVIN